MKVVVDNSAILSEPCGQPQRQPAISARGLCKSFGKTQVLGGVDLDISDNELLVVLGPSGSGKTTLLRIIAGLDHPDSGEILLSGRRVNELPPQARGIGVVFQEQALFQKMPVEANIAFGMKIRNSSGVDISRRVDEMLELTRLQNHRHKLPGQLSGGQRQRVAVARALAFNPTALLFDEPFSALDAVTRAELRREVRAILQEMEVPSLFITHDQEEALELADRIAVLNNGQIEQVDTPFEIYNHPKSEFVATFLGAANVLFGRWRDGYVSVGGLRLTAPDNALSFADRQPVKIVFRPEDLVLNFQPQFLDTPFYLGSGVVEDISYTGPTERLIVRLTFKTQSETSGQQRALALVDKAFDEGFPITVTRTKWDASEMNLSAGDHVVVGLKDYRLLTHYPLHGETGAKVVKG